MKKLSFFLMAMLVSLTSFAAALGDGYEKVTNISNLTTGDRVVVYADAISKGVTGWNGNKDATVAESGWVEYLVEVASGGVYLKDETANNYIASPGNSNQFKYGTKAVCSVDADGVLKCNSRLLCQNGTYYRMYTSVGSYKPFYVYKVIADAGGDETEDLGDALKWSATSATVQMGADDNEYPTLTNDKNVDVIYSSESEAVATIDANGVVTLVKEGTTTISALYEGGEIDGVTYSAKNVSYTLTVKPAPLVIEPIEGGIIDILTHKTLAATSSSYANFTDKQAANENHSDAVYAGRSARNGNATQYSIQLNTIDKGRIATTTSGGIVKRVYVRWSTQATLNTNARALNIYGSNDAFTGSETAAPSTKIGTITFTTGAAEAYVDLEGDYKHILITGSGAIYMDEIQVTWVAAEGTVTTPTISGADEFIESTEVIISAEDGLKVYYTLDGTDPTNASTEYTAPFELTATTTVKAVAYDGENASDIVSKTFKQLQVLTCEEAAAMCTSTESADKYVIRGYVTNIVYAYDAGYNNTSFWMADTKDGGKVFEAFRSTPIAAADQAVKVGDYVEVIGKIVLYGTTPETTQGGTYTIIPAPVINHTITVSANPAEAGTVTGGGEFEETDEITVKAVANDGYEFVNWTENEVEVSTDAEYTFEVLADRALVANFKEVEPEVIAYELNGGELVVEVPTQEELWASFKTAAGLTTLGTLAEITEAGAGKPHSDQDNPCACRIICAKLLDANVNAIFALPEWAWLKAYIMTVQSGLPEASSAAWRYAIAAFFLQSEHSAWPASADFSEAGKPEAWGAAYEAAHAVVLPTEPVAEDYVLPTPVKDGFTFVGWYDNAEGTGEAYTVIPAGWSGTLYAIWKQDPTTALENVAVEGKAVKAIINGQLIIIKNGVRYNAQGAVVK